MSPIAAGFGVTAIAVAAAEAARRQFLVGIVIFVMLLVTGPMAGGARLHAQERILCSAHQDFLCAAHPLFACAAGNGAA
jgi:uncharacterized membrane protein YtjA (UPF0391 family)